MVFVSIANLLVLKRGRVTISEENQPGVVDGYDDRSI